MAFSFPDNRFSLSQHRFFSQENRRELSPTTPVIDSIEGLNAFAQEAIDEVRKGYAVDIYVIGRSGDGKSAISEQLIQKDRESEKTSIRRGYFNTSMAVEEARKKGLITSPFGQITAKEYQRISQDVIKNKLEHTEDGLPRLRVLEFPAVEHAVDLGRSALVYSKERAERDVLYQRRLIGVIGEKALHRRSRRMREDMWKVETPESLGDVFRRYRITPKPPHLHPVDMRQRMGPPASMERIDADVLGQVLYRQGDIRLIGIDKSLPMLDAKALRQDSELEIRALSGLYRLQAHEHGFEDQDVFIAVNRLLRRRIPYYGDMRNDPQLRL